MRPPPSPPHGASRPAAPPARHPLILPYCLAHALLAISHLLASIASFDSYGISRSVLQLASTLSLFPCALAARRRAPALAALAAAVALVVDASLRLLAAVHHVAHGSGVLRSSRRGLGVSALQFALSAAVAAFVAPRATPHLRAMSCAGESSSSAAAAAAAAAPVEGLAAGGGGTGAEMAAEASSSEANANTTGTATGTATATATATAKGRSRSRRRRGARRADGAVAAVDLGLVMILLHAGSCSAARAADLVAAASVGAMGDVLPALVDGVASVACIVALFRPVGMLCRVLLQATPARLRPSLQGRLDRAAALDGVFRVTRANFWEETPGVCVGAISLVASSAVAHGLVVSGVTNVFDGVVDHLFVEVEEEERAGESMGIPGQPVATQILGAPRPST